MPASHPEYTDYEDDPFNFITPTGFLISIEETDNPGEYLWQLCLGLYVKNYSLAWHQRTSALTKKHYGIDTVRLLPGKRAIWTMYLFARNNRPPFFDSANNALPEDFKITKGSLVKASVKLEEVRGSLISFCRALQVIRMEKESSPFSEVKGGFVFSK